MVVVSMLVAVSLAAWEVFHHKDGVERMAYSKVQKSPFPSVSSSSHCLSHGLP